VTLKLSPAQQLAGDAYSDANGYTTPDGKRDARALLRDAYDRKLVSVRLLFILALGYERQIRDLQGSLRAAQNARDGNAPPQPAPAPAREPEAAANGSTPTPPPEGRPAPPRTPAGGRRPPRRTSDTAKRPPVRSCGSCVRPRANARVL